jgi:hypothetical protein
MDEEEKDRVIATLAVWVERLEARVQKLEAYRRAALEQDLFYLDSIFSIGIDQHRFNKKTPQRKVAELENSHNGLVTALNKAGVFNKRPSGGKYV